MRKRLIALAAIVWMAAMLMPAALSAGKMTLEKEAFLVVPSYGTTIYGYYFAEIQNTGDAVLGLQDAVLILLGKEGAELRKREWFNSYPQVINPGESAYISVYDYLDTEEVNDEIASYSFDIKASTQPSIKTTMYTVGDAAYQLEQGDYSNSAYVTALIKNETDAPCYNINAVIVLRDAEGELLYVDSTTLYGAGIPAGSEILMRMEVTSDIVDHFVNQDIEPASVEVLAYTEEHTY
jgi:hypothetical protein